MRSKIVTWIIGLMLAALIIYAVFSGLLDDVLNPFTPPKNP